MKAKMGRLPFALKARQQLGWKVSLLYAWYQLGLRIGWFKLLTPAYGDTWVSDKEVPYEIEPLDLPWPEQGDLERILGRDAGKVLAEADEIVEGKVRLFGGDPIDLKFEAPEAQHHWTKHTAAWVDGQDVKIPWEMGRFGWATVLARAYRLSGVERYPQAFWKYTEAFLSANPPNRGIQWASAQEAAVRLVALALCFQLLASSPETTPRRVNLLKQALIAHARRIPPTLGYARAQDNNHLLTEAVGLYTAAAVLPTYLDARRWHRLGWKWLNYALQNQIAPDGAYVQNSSNYHRVMLQAGLWAARVAESQGEAFPEGTNRRLAAATQWLLTLLDEESGKVPNLGANDGAYILPLTVCEYGDCRPVLQAAGKAFLDQAPLPEGAWDEMAAWLSPQAGYAPPAKSEPLLIRLDGKTSWAFLRAAPSTNRHGHADQLHVDLWWRGLNVAQDAGTYLYNAPPPWENPLSSTEVHNTVTINGENQMTRAGRFLWLDWNQARLTAPPSPTIIRAEHNGYEKFGVTHQRSVKRTSVDIWEITDKIIATHGNLTDIRLQWLLPDWAWEIAGTTLRLKSPHGWMVLDIQGTCPLKASLTRAGKLLSGEGQVQSHHGWVSHTYNEKSPALSFAITTRSTPPITLVSQWEFPG
jgi:hypothetical protein